MAIWLAIAEGDSEVKAASARWGVFPSCSEIRFDKPRRSVSGSFKDAGAVHISDQCTSLVHKIDRFTRWTEHVRL